MSLISKIRIQDQYITVIIIIILWCERGDKLHFLSFPTEAGLLSQSNKSYVYFI